ncbi:MAG: hypothetical protein ACRD0J_02525 [Acidimicrobiales bacterium]
MHLSLLVGACIVLLACIPPALAGAGVIRAARTRWLPALGIPGLGFLTARLWSRALPKVVSHPALAHLGMAMAALAAALLGATATREVKTAMTRYHVARVPPPPPPRRPKVLVKSAPLSFSTRPRWSPEAAYRSSGQNGVLSEALR